jgi:hypothetical protein
MPSETPAVTCRRFVSAAAIVLIGALMTVPESAAARPLPPGGSNDALTDPFVGVTLADRPELAGDIIADFTQPFSDPSQLFEGGVLRTIVVRETVSKTLDFYYDTDPGFDTFSVSGFDLRPLDVEVRTDFPAAPGDPSGGAVRSADGDKVTFVFRGSFTFLQTDATTFDRSGTGEFTPDGFGHPITIGDVAVPSAIPLPPAVYAGLSGLVMVAGYCCRLRQRHSQMAD